MGGGAGVEGGGGTYFIYWTGSASAGGTRPEYGMSSKKMRSNTSFHHQTSVSFNVEIIEEPEETERFRRFHRKRITLSNKSYRMLKAILLLHCILHADETLKINTVLCFELSISTVQHEAVLSGVGTFCARSLSAG
jgi:hypothetical protein